MKTKRMFTVGKDRADDVGDDALLIVPILLNLKWPCLIRNHVVVDLLR